MLFSITLAYRNRIIGSQRNIQRSLLQLFAPTRDQVVQDHIVRSWNTSKERHLIINMDLFQPFFKVNFCPLLCNQNYIYLSSLFPLVLVRCAALRRRAPSSLHPPITTLHTATRFCLQLLFSAQNHPRSLCLLCPSLHCSVIFF